MGSLGALVLHPPLRKDFAHFFYMALTWIWVLYHFLLNSHISMFTLHYILIHMPLTCMCDPCLHLHISHHPMPYLCDCMLVGDFRLYCHVICVPHAFHMLCTHYCQTPPYVATLILEDFYMLYVECTNVLNLGYEVTPILFSHRLGDFDMARMMYDCFPSLHNMHDDHYCYAICHVYTIFSLPIFCANGELQEKRCVMMDDAFVYHAHTYFAIFCAFVGSECLVSVTSPKPMLPFPHGDVDLDPRTDLPQGGGR